MAIAVVVLVVAAVSYLHPGAGTRPAATPVALPQPVTEPVAVSFGDAQHGAVTVVDRSGAPAAQATPPTAWLTADGGRTWRRHAIAPGGLVFVRFDAPLHAVTVIGVSTTTTFAVTEDGGWTWRFLAIPGAATRLIGLPTFLDPARGWWLWNPVPGDTGEARSVGLWRTDDGGHTWERLDASGIPAPGDQIGLRFRDRLHGVLTSSGPDRETSLLLATDDGGETWRAVASFHGPGPGVDAVMDASVFVHGGRMIAVLTWLEGASVGPTGIIVARGGTGGPVVSLVSYSDDGGQAWSRPLLAPFVFRDTGSLSLPAMDDRGRLVALNGRTFWISADDGITWESRAAMLPRGLRAADAIVVAAGALFVRATDGTRITVP